MLEYSFVHVLFPNYHISKMVHFQSVAKGVRILIVLVDVGLVGHPGNVSPQLLQLILQCRDDHDHPAIY